MNSIRDRWDGRKKTKSYKYALWMWEFVRLWKRACVHHRLFTFHWNQLCIEPRQEVWLYVCNYMCVHACVHVWCLRVSAFPGTSRQSSLCVTTEGSQAASDLAFGSLANTCHNLFHFQWQEATTHRQPGTMLAILGPSGVYVVGLNHDIAFWDDNSVNK